MPKLKIPKTLAGNVKEDSLFYHQHGRVGARISADTEDGPWGIWLDTMELIQAKPKGLLMEVPPGIEIGLSNDDHKDAGPEGA